MEKSKLDNTSFNNNQWFPSAVTNAFTFEALIDCVHNDGNEIQNTYWLDFDSFDKHNK